MKCLDCNKEVGKDFFKPLIPFKAVREAFCNVECYHAAFGKRMFEDARKFRVATIWLTLGINLGFTIMIISFLLWLGVIKI